MMHTKIPSLQFNVFIILIFGTIGSIHGGGGDFFNYKNQIEWPKHNPQCEGRQQSPIDIDTRRTKLDPEMALKFTGYNKPIPGHLFNLENNGHTVQLTLKVDSFDDLNDIPTVTGSALNGDSYRFRQLHFHWHMNKDSGSEHAIDNKRYDLEMHYVHVNSKYEDAQALNRNDGLVVLGTLFQIVRKNNTFLNPLISGLDRVAKPESRITFDPNQLILDELLPNNLDHFFKYSGSLTTPPCSESVTWILFSEITGISDYQIKSFQRLEKFSDDDHGKTEPMKYNVRDLQKRQKREIFVSGQGVTIKGAKLILLLITVPLMFLMK